MDGACRHACIGIVGHVHGTVVRLGDIVDRAVHGHRGYVQLVPGRLPVTAGRVCEQGRGVLC
jgi:hypothetical protein